MTITNYRESPLQIPATSVPVGAFGTLSRVLIAESKFPQIWSVGLNVSYPVQYNNIFVGIDTDVLFQVRSGTARIKNVTSHGTSARGTMTTVFGSFVEVWASFRIGSTADGTEFLSAIAVEGNADLKPVMISPSALITTEQPYPGSDLPKYSTEWKASVVSADGFEPTIAFQYPNRSLGPLVTLKASPGWQDWQPLPANALSATISHLGSVVMLAR